MEHSKAVENRSAAGVDSFAVTWNSPEDDLAGFAVAGFDGVDEARADVGRECEAIGEDVDGACGFVGARGGGEVEVEERLGRGELDDLAGCVGVSVGLPEAVEAAAAEFGEALFERVGDVERGSWRGSFFFADFFAARFAGLASGSIALGWRCRALHGLEFYLAALDREEYVDARAFRLARARG